jgi:pimeloyl-ACP methyl ester carboxylesterase
VRWGYTSEKGLGARGMAVEKWDVEVEGLPIRYLTAGTGPPLVLLHGAGDNTLDWRWVMPHLAATHRVYAPDLPGSPNSARPTVDYSPAFFERFVAGFLDVLEIGPATFVGNSFGGLIALPASARRRYPSGGHRSAPTRGPGGERRCSSRIPPELSRANGWRNSAGWRSRRATWRHT